MYIAKLTISVQDSGVAFNDAQDLGLEQKPETTRDGLGLVRGLGTHFKSVEAKQRYQRLMTESNMIRERFKRQFLVSPIDSVFVIGERGQAKTFADQMEQSEDLHIQVTEFELGTANGGLDEKEMEEWTARIKTQFKRIPLGRGEEVDEEGLQALDSLSKCPVISQAVGEAIRGMIQQVRVGSMKRMDFKRNIQSLELELDQTALQPRRPTAEPVA